MVVRCPGYLNAKSLLEDGECREDYAEWFSSPALSAHRPLIDAVYGAMKYRGAAPVLLACDVSPGLCLLFRFTMKSSDRKGRPHQRCEVIQVGRSRLPELLDGEFRAVPDAGAMEFAVEGVGREALPRCERHEVRNTALDVFTRDPKAYWFKSEKNAPGQPLNRQSACAPSPVGRLPGDDETTKGRKVMSKALLTLLVLTSALGAWHYAWSIGEISRLRKDLAMRNDEVENCRGELAALRCENGRLQEENGRFDRWVKTRGNFELNKVQLKIKLDEIRKGFSEAEDLMAHIDEDPEFQPDVADADNASEGNSPSWRTGRKVENRSASSRWNKTEIDDEKEEKSLFDGWADKVRWGRRGNE